MVWAGFTGVVLVLLFLDLAVLNRKTHALTMREASLWSGSIVAMALLFGGFLWWLEGTQHALEYFTGYIIELSLSVDNLFVFLLIFQYFAVPAALQARVLKWGIIGAIVMRAVMIGVGALLLARFHWIIYLFGGILVITGIRMLTLGDDARIEPEKNPVVRLARKLLPFTAAYDGNHFFIRTASRWVATPLFLVVLVVEWSDLVFAIDSIPAIFAITNDTFIVYSSNVFAILGLRALYFVLAGAMDKFRFLKPAVAGILIFVGFKMAASAMVKVPTGASLGVIVGFLVAGIALSVWLPKDTTEGSLGG